MSGRPTIALDWDDTLVDVKTQDWLPNALAALKSMLHDANVIIHTCRANWPEGRASIETKLSEAIPTWRLLGVEIVGKPSATVYIDNQALRFEGDWTRTIVELRHAAAGTFDTVPPC